MSHMRCSLPSTKSNRTSDFVSYSVSLWQKSTELGARTSRPQIVEFPKLSKSCGQMVACQRSGGRRKQGHARPCRDGGWNERIKFSMDRVEKLLDPEDLVAGKFRVVNKSERESGRLRVRASRCTRSYVYISFFHAIKLFYSPSLEYLFGGQRNREMHQM